MTQADDREMGIVSSKTVIRTPVLVFLTVVVLMLAAKPTAAFAGEARVEATLLGAKLVYEDATNNSSEGQHQVAFLQPGRGIVRRA